MKKIWKIRKDKEAVSPVIATILMVAITVVLAAVLYVMVIGIEPPDKVTAGTWTDVGATSQTTARAEFGDFIGTMKPIDLRIYISANGTDIGFISWSSNTDPTSIKWNFGPDGGSVSYRDYAPEKGEINSGDYIDFSGLSSGTLYEITAHNADLDKKITGMDTSFSTP